MQVFHGTKRDAYESILENGFNVATNEDCKLYLGSGIYFYLDKYNAIDYCINKKSKAEKFNNFIEKVMIIKVEIDDNINMLDLDDREVVDYLLDFYNEFHEIIMKTKYKPFFEKGMDKKRRLSAFMNIIKNHNILIDFDGIKKTITEQIECYDEIGVERLPRLVFCLFDNNKIKKIEECEINENEFMLCKKLHVKLEV